jgi:hypothetical protein
MLMFVENNHLLTKFTNAFVNAFQLKIKEKKEKIITKTESN